MQKTQDLEIVTEQEGDGYYIAQIKTKELAIFTYYLESNKEAVIIDPIFNTKGYQNFVLKRHSAIKYVVLTHYHADFLSGHLEFNGVPIIMGPSSIRADSKFKIKQHQDGSLLKFGSVAVKIIHTPGHTLESSCFLLKDKLRKDIALFSGDTVFLGDVGRPDLSIKSELTVKDLAGLLYDSIQKLKELTVDIRLYPGHGAGSSCGKSIGAGNYCTLGAQFQKNYGFLAKSKEEFVKEVSQNLPKPPAYFVHNASLNQKGFQSYNSHLNNVHKGLTLQEFSKYINLVKIIDTRNNPGNGIIKGSYWIPEGGPISNWISFVLHPHQQFLLVVDNSKALQTIERLLRIGYLKIKGYNNFEIQLLKAELGVPKILKFEDVKALKGIQHLDVRNIGEYHSLGVNEGSILIPLPELQSRVAQLKNIKDLVINCLSGFRSKIAFSILSKHNIPSVILAEDFKQFQNHGFTIVPYTQ